MHNAMPLAYRNKHVWLHTVYNYKHTCIIDYKHTCIHNYKHKCILGYRTEKSISKTKSLERDVAIYYLLEYDKHKGELSGHHEEALQPVA